MDLPEEVLLSILKILEPKPRELAELQRVNRPLSRLARDNSLWRTWTPAEDPSASLYKTFCNYIKQAIPSSTVSSDLLDSKASLLAERGGPKSIPAINWADSDRILLETSLWLAPLTTMPRLAPHLQHDAGLQKRAAYAMRWGPDRNRDLGDDVPLPVSFAGDTLLDSPDFAADVVALFGPSFIELNFTIRDNKKFALAALGNWPNVERPGEETPKDTSLNVDQAISRFDRIPAIRFFRSLGPSIRNDLDVQARLVARDPRVIVDLFQEDSCHLWQKERSSLLLAASSTPFFFALPATRRWSEDREIALNHYARYPSALSAHLPSSLSGDMPWLGALLNRTPHAFQFLPTPLKTCDVLSLIKDPFLRFTNVCAANRVNLCDLPSIRKFATEAARVAASDAPGDALWLEYFPEHVQRRAEFLEKLIQVRPYLYLGLTPQMKLEPRLYRAALKTCPDLVTSLPSEVYEDVDAVISALKKSPSLGIKLPRAAREKADLLQRFLPICAGHSIVFWNEHLAVAQYSPYHQKLWLTALVLPTFMSLSQSFPAKNQAQERHLVLCEMRRVIGAHLVLSLSLPLFELEASPTFSKKIAHLFRAALQEILKRRQDLSHYRAATLLQRSLTMTPTSSDLRQIIDWIAAYKKLCVSFLLFEVKDEEVPLRSTLVRGV